MTHPLRAVSFVDGQNLFVAARDAFGIRDFALDRTIYEACAVRTK